MSRYFIQLSFKGTDYCGWQIQANAVTVQSTLNKALCTFLKEEIETTGAGRTDTGVHADFFIAHFDSVSDDLDKQQDLIYHLNGILPRDIAIQKIFRVNDDSHARFDAVSRTYKYYITNNKDPFGHEYALYLSSKPDITKMNKCAEVLKDHTDFTSFSKLHSNTKTNDCKISGAEWKEKNGRIVFTITADRFLRNMVRAIVGTLIEAGKGKLTVEEFRNIIESKDRGKAGASAPAHGLFLTNIEYPDIHVSGYRL